jgi:galactokinase
MLAATPNRLHPHLRPVVDRAVAAFERWAGRRPAVAAAAPGRVNLIGEHTDYNDGYVLPMAIDRWCVAAGSPGGNRVLGDDVGQAVEFDPDRADAASLAHAPWARYPVGVIWTMRERVPSGRWGGVQAAIASSVPLGSGLSSSASIEVAAASLVDRLFALGLSAEALAEIGREAEHRFAGVPCGIMDQLISACATPGTATLIDCRSRRLSTVVLPAERECAVVIAHSGVRHALASGEYAQRRASCRRAAQALGVAALRDADQEMLRARERTISAEELACARHVVSENRRVLEFVDALARGELDRAGVLLYASHQSLRDDFRVSCPELDALVDAARAVRGVFGSRMTGGGFGGCTVTLCRPEAAGELCATLRRAVPAEGTMEPFVAAPVGGAAAWSIGK